MRSTSLFLASIVSLLFSASCADENTAGDGGEGGANTSSGGANAGGTNAAGAPQGGSANGGASDGGAASGAGGMGGTPTTGGEGGTGPTTECGNTRLESGEECDDGNTMDGDGCSAACLFEPTGPDDVCPGEEIALSPVVDDLQTASIGSSTTTALGQYDSACGGSGHETVYLVTPAVSGQLTATLTSDFDAVLHGRSDCAAQESELDCSDQSLADASETISFEVFAGVPAYLFVDGYGGEEGNFSLAISVATAFCGNGVAELPEACDDGNLTAGDGCATDCTIEPGGLPDACPGQTFFVSDPDPTAVRTLGLLGDTSVLGTGISATSCTASGPQAVYAIVPDVDGAMHVDLLASYDGATLHVRNECDITAAQLDCVEAVDPSESIGVTVPVFANNTYFVFVDSSSSSNSGPFAANVTVTPAECGNDEVDGGEECDDGNAVVGDGCAPDCTLETSATSNDVCPGAPLTFVGSPPSAVVTASTAALAANYQGSGCATTTTAKEAVYAVAPPIDGRLDVTVDPSFDGAVYVRSDCLTTGATAQLGCVDALDGNGTETLGVPVVAGSTYYVFVDSSTSTQFGVFELQLSVSPGACNNGILEGAEQCDDGNTLAGDGCAADCTLEPAGAEDTCPGEVLPLQPSGTDYIASVYSGLSNLASNYTASGCTSTGRDAVYQIVAPIDGVLTATLPTAGFNASLHAQTTCGTNGTQLDCANDNSGNGTETIRFAVQQGATYYVIVDSASTTSFGPFQLDVSIVPPGCGDGFVNASGGEECDDANFDAGDGCSPTCTMETLTGNDTCPGYAIVLSDPDPTVPRTTTMTNDTSALVSNVSGTCGGSGPDAVYMITSDIDGTLSAKLFPSPGLSPVLHSRSTCNNAGTQLACDDAASSGYTNSFPINANIPYYIFVDGLSGQSGVSTLTITVTP
ncbi:MAG: DUF4215 domain-containing protein [Polyangiaceae bacterium]|nr:DUF4215 domain-containing protein [Polyangiaceae bacterium]